MHRPTSIKEIFMLSLLRRLIARRAVQAEFCDGCAQVCDGRCRGGAAREQARTQATAHRFGL
jgi:hypothetical protein